MHLNRQEGYDRLPSLASLYASAYFMPKLEKLKQTKLPGLETKVEGIRIDGQRLASYQKMCGFRPSSMVPISFYFVLSQPVMLSLFGDKRFPHRIPGLLQVSSRIKHFGATHAGEVFDIHTRVGNGNIAKSGHYFDVTSDIFVADRLVCQCINKFVAGHKTTKTDAGSIPPFKSSLLQPTMAHWTLPKNAGLAYAKVSGDFNPIHLHPWTARLFGFTQPVAHGMYLLAKVSAHLEQQMHEQCGIMTMKFKRPVLLPADVHLATEAIDKGIRFNVFPSQPGKPYATGHYRDIL